MTNYKKTGYEDYNALGLPPEYAEQDHFEQMEQYVVEKMKSVGLGDLAKNIIYTDVWNDFIYEMVEAERV